MLNWNERVQAIETLQDLPLNKALVSELEQDWLVRSRAPIPPIHFYTPTFKSFQTSEIKSCGKNAWPAVSITGSDCKLQCDHCKTKILESMLPARSPEALWRVVNERIADGAMGMLLTGGSNHRNEVEYGPFYPTIRRIKQQFPDFRIAAHAALIDAAGAQAMADAGVDVAMLDVIGAQETITQVYHLRRSVSDFEASLAHLVNSPLKVVPHIVIGLHYGQLLGEWEALKIIRRNPPDALVLVVVMPYYAPKRKPFAAPDVDAIGAFFRAARAALPETPLLLGCARPPGIAKLQIDSYAVMAGLDGIAHPGDGVVELAARLGRRVRVTPACCSIVVGEEVMAMSEQPGTLELDVATILSAERAHRETHAHSLRGIPVVGATIPHSSSSTGWGVK